MNSAVRLTVAVSLDGFDGKFGLPKVIERFGHYIVGTFFYGPLCLLLQRDEISSDAIARCGLFSIVENIPHSDKNRLVTAG